MPLLVAQADYNIAYLYYLRGEYSRAIEALYAARAPAKPPAMLIILRCAIWISPTSTWNSI